MPEFFTVAEFRRVLKRTLREGGLSVQEAANDMHLSSRTLYHFLNGKNPSVETLGQLAGYLGGKAGVAI